MTDDNQKHLSHILQHAILAKYVLVPSNRLPLPFISCILHLFLLQIFEDSEVVTEFPSRSCT